MDEQQQQPQPPEERLPLFRRTENITENGRECYLRRWNPDTGEWEDGLMVYEVLAE